MDAPGIFAQREWLAVSPEGQEISISLCVGVPQQGPNGEWISMASLMGLVANAHEVHGADSWQAIDQAMFHVAQMIKHFEVKGWTFYWDSLREPAFSTDLYRSPANSG